MEEKDANLEPEAKDVEGHAVNTGVNLDREEDDDVEGHVNYGVNTAVNLRQDEGDDVEGHVNI